MESNRLVAVAMSGGVDSSVAAALLVEQGYPVVGLMLRLWSRVDNEDTNRCCTPTAVSTAQEVAAILGIPFYVIDAREIFRQNVVDKFIEEYSAGRTPNPCLICNQAVRWGFLFDKAKDMGAKFFATGHYARLTEDSAGRKALLRSVDEEKDQTYVLSFLEQSQLKNTLFPLGGLHKSDVRNLAKKFHLPVAEKPDSQDLCFVGEVGYRKFLTEENLASNNPGNIVDPGGKVIGIHQGLAFYTIGQRRGLGLSIGKPMYVIGKDMAQNCLIVSDNLGLERKEFFVKGINWISGDVPGKNFKATVKIRYRTPDTLADVMRVNGTSASVVFKEPVRSITPGQAAVFYQSDNVLGGGIIDVDFDPK